jgi:hypothetical protein
MPRPRGLPMYPRRNEKHNADVSWVSSVLYPGRKPAFIQQLVLEDSAHRVGSSGIEFNDETGGFQNTSCRRGNRQQDFAPQNCIAHRCHLALEDSTLALGWPLSRVNAVACFYLRDISGAEVRAPFDPYILGTIGFGNCNQPMRKFCIRCRSWVVHGRSPVLV